MSLSRFIRLFLLAGFSAAASCTGSDGRSTADDSSRTGIPDTVAGSPANTATAPAPDPAVADSGASVGAGSSDSLYFRLTGAGDGDFSIGPATSEAELIARFGAANVSRFDFSLGEGEFEPGTALFPGDSTRLLEIRWADTATRVAPALIRAWKRTRGWTIASGITVGSTLADVERANGRVFTLVGFAFDYEGTSTSWDGGRFDGLPTGVERVIVRFTPTAPKALSNEEWARVSGDRELRSNDPLVRRLMPHAYSVEIWFKSPGS